MLWASAQSVTVSDTEAHFLLSGRYKEGIVDGVLAKYFCKVRPGVLRENFIYIYIYIYIYVCVFM